MFNNLSDNLEKAFKNLKGEGKLTEINIAQSVKEIRRALVAADVNYKIAKEFTNTVKEKALGQENILSSVKPGELIVPNYRVTLQVQVTCVQPCCWHIRRDGRRTCRESWKPS